MHEIRVPLSLNRGRILYSTSLSFLTELLHRINQLLIDSPWGVTGDIHGNGYVSDHTGNVIYKVVDDNVTLFAGSNDSFSILSGPSGLAVDFQGNVYVADQYNDRIQKIDPTETTAYLLTQDFTGPTDVVFGLNGKLYIADTTRNPGV